MIGSLYFIEGKSNWVEIPVEVSRTTDLAVRIDPMKIRPGTDVKVSLRVNAQRLEKWYDTTNTNKSILFYRRNIGAFDEFGKI